MKFLLAVLLATQAQDISRTVGALERRYYSVQSVSARFTQVYRAPGVEQVESGMLYMKRPGLMRWEYQEPEKKLFIADGRDTYLYTPADRQVLTRSYTAAEMRSTPLRFLLGQGEILQSFSVGWEKEPKPGIEGTLVLRLVPRSRQPDYQSVVIECDEKTFDLRRITIHEPTGNTSEFILTDLATNIKIDNKQFQFKIPKGVEVIRIDN